MIERLVNLLPPRWRHLLGGDAMLHERDLQRIAVHNARWAGQR